MWHIQKFKVIKESWLRERKKKVNFMSIWCGMMNAHEIFFKAAIFHSGIFFVIWFMNFFFAI